MLLLRHGSKIPHPHEYDLNLLHYSICQMFIHPYLIFITVYISPPDCKIGQYKKQTRQPEIYLYHSELKMSILIKRECKLLFYSTSKMFSCVCIFFPKSPNPNNVNTEAK